jgi:hydroxymethylglutaryl-CoA reductase
MDNFKHFLQYDYIPLLKKLTPNQPAAWGKMDAQQMVEHMRLIFMAANGKISLTLLEKDPVHLAKKRAFLLTDHPFPQNAKAPGIPDEPMPYKYSNLEEAIAKLEPEIELMFKVYTADPTLILMHPAFGELDYDLQMKYMHKHVFHHLRQFGLAD